MREQFERIYPFVPLWAQNLGLSLWGLAWKRERLGGDFEKHVAGYCERDRWTPGRMEEFLEAELQRRLVHAFEEVPYYRWTWGKAGWTKSRLARMTRARLTELPVLPKQDVRAQPDAFVAADVARRHALHRYPTSGSTGTPVTHICTSDGHRRFVAGREVRSFGWAGASIREPRSMIGGRMIVPRGVAAPPYYRFNRAEKQVY